MCGVDFINVDNVMELVRRILVMYSGRVKECFVNDCKGIKNIRVVF